MSELPKHLNQKYQEALGKVQGEIDEVKAKIDQLQQLKKNLEEIQNSDEYRESLIKTLFGMKEMIPLRYYIIVNYFGMIKGRRHIISLDTDITSQVVMERIKPKLCSNIVCELEELCLYDAAQDKIYHFGNVTPSSYGLALEPETRIDVNVLKRMLNRGDRLVSLQGSYDYRVL